MSPILDSINLELSTIVDKARMSLVQIRSGRHGAGAGTILHPDGLVVTNAHVILKQPLEITLWDGRSFSGRLLAIDKKVDLALLAIEAEELPVIELGNGAQLRPGQWVVSLGHPWGVRGATTAGMVIAVGKPAQGVGYQGELIQVGLRLRPGHSGGPMVDGRGRLVGINTMISGPEIGLAVPIQRVKYFLKQNLGSRPS